MNKMSIPHSKPTLGKKEKEALAKVIDSGYIARGPSTLNFEKKLTQFIGTKYAFATNSGTASLHLSLLALKVEKRDEVIIPSYVCSALYSSILFTGATPVVVDVNYSDGNINAESITKGISKKTKAIIVPHIFGKPADIDSISDLGYPIIEDCAHSIGAEYKATKVGNFGELSIFSFYPTKMLATGAGGAVLTNNKEFIDFVKDVGDYVHKKSPMLRFNYAMNDVNASIGLVQLAKLPTFIERRNKIAKMYDEFFSCFDVEIPQRSNNIQSVYYRYLIKFPKYIKSVKIKNCMKTYGISCSTNDYALHRIYSLDKKKFLNTEMLLDHGLSIPIYPSLSDKEIDYIFDCFKKAYKR